MDYLKNLLAFFDFSPSVYVLPRIEIPRIECGAERWLENLRKRILEVRRLIEDGQSLLIYSCNSSGEMMIVDNFGWGSPDQILLCGYDGAGNYTQELTNVSNVNVRLKILTNPIDESTPPNRRIGFIQD